MPTTYSVHNSTTKLLAMATVKEGPSLDGNKPWHQGANKDGYKERSEQDVIPEVSSRTPFPYFCTRRSRIDTVHGQGCLVRLSARFRATGAAGIDCELDPEYQIMIAFWYTRVVKTKVALRFDRGRQEKGWYPARCSRTPAPLMTGG